MRIKISFLKYYYLKKVLSCFELVPVNEVKLSRACRDLVTKKLQFEELEVAVDHFRSIKGTKYALEPIFRPADFKMRDSVLERLMCNSKSNDKFYQI